MRYCYLYKCQMKLIKTLALILDSRFSDRKKEINKVDSTKNYSHNQNYFAIPFHAEFASKLELS